MSNQSREHDAAARAAAIHKQNPCTVTDLVLASALLAVGVPLLATPKLISFGNGRRQAVFTFAASDPERIVNTQAAVRLATKDPYAYIASNPVCPLSFALAGIIRYADYARQFQTSRPVIPMTAPGKGASAVLWVTEGSRKHVAALRRGMVPAPGRVEPSALEQLVSGPPVDTSSTNQTTE
jgi:hypothetical protein